MNEHVRVMLAVAARLTSYPSDSFREDLLEIKDFADQHLDEGPTPFAIARMTEGLIDLPLREIQEKYVAAFDLKERTNLYLTAHELGDSRKRGIALIELREFIYSNGFAPVEGELPDYIPLLYELASEVPEDQGVQKLMDRLAYATHRIRRHLSDENPYKQVFETMMDVVFDEPSEEAMKEIERNREKPDLDPMPFPLMYK